MDISNVKIRNKIIRILAVVLLVFSFIITPVVNSPRLAYASSINVVGASDPYEDLKISKGFDESKLENVDDIVVLDMFEYWPSDDAQYPQLLLYVYNPTDSDLKKSTDNRIHIRIGGIDSDTLELNWVRHWNSYKLEYLTTSANDKYVKYMVSDEDTQTIFSLFSEYESGLRYYDISEVKLAKDNNRTPSSYTVGFKYLFEVENGELFCKKEEYNVIRVDNLIPMVYRDIKSGVYNYPSGQINSVAFTLPKDIVEKYGEVSEIHFEYWKYKTSPIVVSDTRDGVNLYQNNDSWVGKKQSELSSYYPSIRWGNKKDKGSQTVPKIVYKMVFP